MRRSLALETQELRRYEFRKHRRTAVEERDTRIVCVLRRYPDDGVPATTELRRHIRVEGEVNILPIERLQTVIQCYLHLSGGDTFVESFRWLSGIQSEVDLKAMPVAGSDLPLDYLEALLLRPVHDSHNIVLTDSVILLAQSFDHTVEIREAPLVDLNTELVGSMTQHKRKQL
jgi:hypothetical protein